jgi:hypothetical protein
MFSVRELGDRGNHAVEVRSSSNPDDAGVLTSFTLSQTAHEVAEFLNRLVVQGEKS